METARVRVRQFRQERKWTQRELADRVAAFGIPNWDDTTVAEIERPGGRGLDVDELLALAFALGVSPLVLLLPADDSPVRLSPNTVTGSPANAAAWIRGDLPMGGTRPGEAQTDENRRFYETAI